MEKHDLDDDDFEWTSADFARARPAREVLPDLVAGMAALKRARGRPAKADKKPQITLRLDADIVVWLKSLGSGYNQRANAMLRLFRDNAALFQK